MVEVHCIYLLHRSGNALRFPDTAPVEKVTKLKQLLKRRAELIRNLKTMASARGIHVEDAFSGHPALEVVDVGGGGRGGPADGGKEGVRGQGRGREDEEEKTLENTEKESKNDEERALKNGAAEVEQPVVQESPLDIPSSGIVPSVTGAGTTRTTTRTSEKVALRNSWETCGRTVQLYRSIDPEVSEKISPPITFWGEKEFNVADMSVSAAAKLLLRRCSTSRYFDSTVAVSYVPVGTAVEAGFEDRSDSG